jgi:hypothetical protein
VALCSDFISMLRETRSTSAAKTRSSRKHLKPSTASGPFPKIKAARRQGHGMKERATKDYEVAEVVDTKINLLGVCAIPISYYNLISLRRSGNSRFAGKVTPSRPTVGSSRRMQSELPTILIKLLADSRYQYARAYCCFYGGKYR